MMLRKYYPQRIVFNYQNVVEHINTIDRSPPLVSVIHLINCHRYGLWLA